MTDLNSLMAYDFNLPPELIAQRPAEPRDSSRLLVVDRARGTWEHRKFTDLPSYLNPSDLLVANNAQVLKSRLLGQRLLDDGKLGGKVEFLLLEEIQPRIWEGAFHASAKHRPGVRFWIPTPDGKGVAGTLVRGASESPHGTVVAEFDRDPVAAGAGVIPLPHYIDREATAQDEQLYQTIYAKKSGSAAAPTAGFHFTERVLKELRERGVGWDEITLHVGLGTFRPVKASDIRDHVMHEERFEISDQTVDKILATKAAGKKVVAVGTTSVRALEGAALDGGLRSGLGRTSIFIHPGKHEFKVIDRIITNFHLPKSTLLMLICAFAGRDLVLSAYEDAVREKYRFFSYGDAMLIC